MTIPVLVLNKQSEMVIEAASNGLFSDTKVKNTGDTSDKSVKDRSASPPAMAPRGTPFSFSIESLLAGTGRSFSHKEKVSEESDGERPGSRLSKHFFSWLYFRSFTTLFRHEEFRVFMVRV